MEPVDEPSRVLEAALIRGYLPELVPAGDANTMDQVVSHLLNDANMDRSELAVQLIHLLDGALMVSTDLTGAVHDEFTSFEGALILEGSTGKW